MTEPLWKQRLRAAVSDALAAGGSMREISLRAGHGPNFVSQLLREEKAPSLDKFLAVCAAMNISPTYILSGLPVTPEAEEILQEILVAQEDVRAALRTIVRSGVSAKH